MERLAPESPSAQGVIGTAWDDMVIHRRPYPGSQGLARNPLPGLRLGSCAESRTHIRIHHFAPAWYAPALNGGWALAWASGFEGLRG
jgi:hypothetical protein